MKNLRKKIPISFAIAAMIIAAVGITPIVASPTSPSLTLIPTISTLPKGGNPGFDSTYYVQVPNNNPTGENGNLYNLYPAFVVESIAYNVAGPGIAPSYPYTLVNCSTSGYPGRAATTSCSGYLAQRAEPRAYWGSNTAVYFLGLAGGFDHPGTYTVTGYVTGLYYNANVTLTGSETITVTP